MFSFKMDDKKLIELVRKHVVLYDYKNPLYGDYDHKKKIWSLIGGELQQPGSLCKTRWNNIRDNYRKTLKKVTSSGEEIPSRIKKYRFAEMLHFLDSHFNEREITVVKAENDLKEDDMWGAQEVDIENAVDVKIELIEDSEEINSSVMDQQSTQGDQNFSERSFPQWKGRPELGNGNCFSNFLNSKNTTCDNVDAFLSIIAPTLKTFSPYHLNIAKSKVFSIVQRYEMKVILEGQQKKKGLSEVLLSSSRNCQSSGSPNTSRSESPVQNSVNKM